MQVTSKVKVALIQDREGIIEEKVRIKIWIDKKDDVEKKYTVKTQDFIYRQIEDEDGHTTDSEQPLINRYAQPQEKTYFKTYEEYDSQRAGLLEMFPSDLTGSELDDYLLLCGLKVSLAQIPIYGLTGNDWE